MYNALHMKTLGKAAGYSLLEVVVAVIILAIGILGMVGLQTATVRQNQNALAMSTATDYANSMLDKMRSNPIAAASGFYSLKKDEVATAVDPGGDGKGQKAREEVDRWRTSLNQALPGVKTQICRMENKDDSDCHTGKGDYYRVAIDWSGTINDNYSESGSEALFEKNTQCIKMVGRL